MWAGQVYVGVVSWDLPEFEIGYVADAGHEGRGYVAEAVWAVLRWVFADLGRTGAPGMRRTNVRSARVAERCGFTLEGRLRQNHRNPDGTLSDTLLYGLLRGERKEPA